MPLLEWLVAMGLVWRIGIASGNRRWQGMTWAMIPSHTSGICACVYHFFYNAPSVGYIVLLQAAFTFLDGPAEVLCAATASRRWHELATADSVWRVKARREGILEKAGVFEVALPSVAGSGGGGAAEEDDEDEAAGVGLAFYAAVFVLKVWLA